MRRLFFIFAILLIACQAVTNVPGSFIASPLSPAPTSSPVPTTLAPSPIPAEPTLAPHSEEAGFKVSYHPDGDLYVGDRVSMEIIPPLGMILKDRQAQVEVDVRGGKILGPVDFAPHGIAGRIQATLLWAWDTSGLEPGSYTLRFSILPAGPDWTEIVTLHPQNQVPLPELQAHWASAESECCIVHYITGTEAERDLPELLTMADEQARDVMERLGGEFKDPIPITFLPRVLGHGGFANHEISISYLDRNYAGSSPDMVLHHEMVHLLDSRMGGDLRPTLFVEGLAVYLTGGHFKPEPLLQRAAALLSPIASCVTSLGKSVPAEGRLAQKVIRPEGVHHQIGNRQEPVPPCGLRLYLPLASLMDDFYFSQHEIGYLQAGALVEFMVETWGWESFNDFYRDIHPQPSGKQIDAVDASLQDHFGISLAELEERFIAVLRKEPLSQDMITDLQLTIRLYDTVRRYQQVLDPPAYFLTAWLPDGKEMREKGIVADYLRHPTNPENQALETLLIAAFSSLSLGDYPRTNQILDAVNASLDVFSGETFNTHLRSWSP